MKPKPAAPVVTMDEDGGLKIDGKHVGKAYLMTEPITVFLDPIWTARDLRAIADFLDQLEGANLLSEVVEG